MTTEAGRRLLDAMNGDMYAAVEIEGKEEETIAAIEAEAREEALLAHADEDAETIERERNEARAALLAELEAGVLTELTHDKVAARMQAVGRPWTVGEAVKTSGDIVLDLIRKAGGA